jgi:DNA adenine methylase
LRDVTLEVADFESVCTRARPGDAVYLDPPYLPISTTSFTAYDRHPFGLAEHERLASVFADLADRRVRSVLSNSSTPQTRELYRGFELLLVGVSRPINSRASERGPIEEILVVNDRRRPSRHRRA